MEKKHVYENSFDEQLQEYAHEERNQSKQMMDDVIKKTELLRDKSFAQNEQRRSQKYGLKTITVESTVEYTDPPVFNEDCEYSELHSAGSVEERDLASQLHIGKYCITRESCEILW